MAYLQNDDCCALQRLRLGPADTEKTIKSSLRDSVANYKNGGITTVYTILTPQEYPTLEPILKDLGFKKSMVFKRRRCYEGRKLKMYKLDVEDYIFKTEKQRIRR